MSHSSLQQQSAAAWEPLLARTAALAQHIGQHVTRLVWLGPDVENRDTPSATAFEASLPSFLAAMQPGHLVKLELSDVQQLPAAAPEVLARLTSIDLLSLHRCRAEAAAAVLAAMRSSLHSLSLSWCDQAVADAIIALPHLTQLFVWTHGSPAAPLQQLTRLRQLRELFLVCWYPTTLAMPAPAPASFPAGLHMYHLQCEGRYHWLQVG